MKIFLINGPNLNFLGKRQTKIYGLNTLSDIESFLIQKSKKRNVNLECYHSNHEGYIVEIIHRAYKDCNSMIINAGALSHSSIAILDALNNFNGTIVEVHMSNIYNREQFRHKSYISKRSNAVISGMGVFGYISALHYLVS